MSGFGAETRSLCWLGLHVLRLLWALGFCRVKGRLEVRFGMGSWEIKGMVDLHEEHDKVGVRAWFSSMV
jgi:hypothetical protein